MTGLYIFYESFPSAQPVDAHAVASHLRCKVGTAKVTQEAVQDSDMLFLGLTAASCSREGDAQCMGTNAVILQTDNLGSYLVSHMANRASCSLTRMTEELMH